MTGVYNTANGAFALYQQHRRHTATTAYGYQALYSNSTGGPKAAAQTAVARLRSFNNTTGLALTRQLAYAALNSNTTGNNNIALGD